MNTVPTYASLLAEHAAIVAAQRATSPKMAAGASRNSYRRACGANCAIYADALADICFRMQIYRGADKPSPSPDGGYMSYESRREVSQIDREIRHEMTMTDDQYAAHQCDCGCDGLGPCAYE